MSSLNLRIKKLLNYTKLKQQWVTTDKNLKMWNSAWGV